MIALLIFTVLFSFIDALNDRLVIKGNQDWHWTKFIKNILMFFGIAYFCAYPIKIYDFWLDTIALTFIGGTIYWCVFDLLLNIVRGKNWLHRGQNFIDKLWLLKPLALFIDFALIWIFLNR